MTSGNLRSHAYCNLETNTSWVKPAWPGNLRSHAYCNKMAVNWLAIKTLATCVHMRIATNRHARRTIYRKLATCVHMRIATS